MIRAGEGLRGPCNHGRIEPEQQAAQSGNHRAFNQICVELHRTPESLGRKRNNTKASALSRCAFTCVSKQSSSQSTRAAATLKQLYQPPRYTNALKSNTG